jgi:hypothetical protein
MYICEPSLPTNSRAGIKIYSVLSILIWMVQWLSIPKLDAPNPSEQGLQKFCKKYAIL